MTGPPDSAAWTGALLVGGASRRMGADKLELRLPDGSRLLDRTAGALRAVCGHCFAVGRRPAASRLPAGFAPLPDAEPACGPLSGLVAALEAARTPWVLVLAADLPLVEPQLLRALQAEALRDPTRALMPQDGSGHLEPLAAAWPAALAPELREALEAGRAAVHEAAPLELRRVWPYAAIQAAARIARPFTNLNAPRDWQSFTGRAPSPP